MDRRLVGKCEKCSFANNRNDKIPCLLADGTVPDIRTLKSQGCYEVLKEIFGW